ncbi:hypothetical protein [Sphingomonas sp. ID0503]|uniref:hypothetical protein n=1 Tax=Sphingomonas sp. ID0503 TaxID=3399691 RepID=UPI003AFB0A77
MTVCVAVKVYDCIVFAADSASSLVGVDHAGKSSVLNVWQHGNKVFNLHKGLPIVAMTCGMGHMGPASISTLAKDLRKELTSGAGKLDLEAYTIEEAVNKAHAFWSDRYAAITPPPPTPHSFEFWIGGISSGERCGEIWQIVIADGLVHAPVLLAPSSQDDGVFWSGQPQAISRLIMGYDHHLSNALTGLGMTVPQRESFLSNLQAQSVTPLVHGAMPVQDAVNLADFLVDLTKRYFAFLPGADVVGGDTDIAAVTKHEGFRWIRRKHYYEPSLNPRETGHV